MECWCKRAEMRTKEFVEDDHSENARDNCHECEVPHGPGMSRNRAQQVLPAI